MYSLKLRGECQSYVGREKDDLWLVHPRDYSMCHRLAKDAVNNGADFLKVPSARRIGGVNVPIFSESEVTDIVSIDECVFAEDGTDLIFQLGATSSSVAVDDVYGLLNQDRMSSA